MSRRPATHWHEPEREGGTSLVETLVALLIGLFVASLALRVVAGQRAVVGTLAGESDALAAARVARVLLGREGRAGDPRRDGWVVSADSLAVRAFRGVACVCEPGPTPMDVVVRVEGVRLPVPAKDSVLVLGADERWEPFALEDADPTGTCARFLSPKFTTQTWRLSGVVPPGAVLARYFERGSYHLTDGAIRYRRGAGGRQPLTPEVVRSGASSFGESAAGVTLELQVKGISAPWRILLAPGGSGSGG